VTEPGTTTIGIAIDIPQPWGELLTRRRAEAGDPVGAHVHAHVTLIGPTEVAIDDLPAIEAHLADVAVKCEPFTLHLRGTGTFRPLTEVVFVAVAAGIGECERLHEALRETPALAQPLRFPYHPHVTIAQNVPTAAMDAAFDDLAGFEAAFPVTGFRLFQHGSDGRWHPQREYVLHGDQRR
jgi:2'-5' RNA ligase